MKKSLKQFYFILYGFQVEIIQGVFLAQVVVQGQVGMFEHLLSFSGDFVKILVVELDLLEFLGRGDVLGHLLHLL